MKVKKFEDMDYEEAVRVAQELSLNSFMNGDKFGYIISSAFAIGVDWRVHENRRQSKRKKR